MQYWQHMRWYGQEPRGIAYLYGPQERIGRITNYRYDNGQVKFLVHCCRWQSQHFLAVSFAVVGAATVSLNAQRQVAAVLLCLPRSETLCPILHG